MAFGINDATAATQQLLTDILIAVKDLVINYIDDNIIFTHSESEQSGGGVTEFWNL